MAFSSFSYRFLSFSRHLSLRLRNCFGDSLWRCDNLWLGDSLWWRDNLCLGNFLDNYNLFLHNNRLRFGFRLHGLVNRDAHWNRCWRFDWLWLNGGESSSPNVFGDFNLEWLLFDLFKFIRSLLLSFYVADDDFTSLSTCSTALFRHYGPGWTFDACVLTFGLIFYLERNKWHPVSLVLDHFLNSCRDWWEVRPHLAEQFTEDQNATVCDFECTSARYDAVAVSISVVGDQLAVTVVVGPLFRH